MNNTNTFYELGVKISCTINPEDNYLVLHNEQGCKKIDLKGLLSSKNGQIINNKETAREIYKYMSETEAFANDKFLVSPKQVQEKLDEYGNFSKQTLEKIWDDLFRAEINDELLKKCREMNLEKLLIYI